jgi:hypothetical protein
MTHFITDEHGNRTFTYKGWEVRTAGDWIGVTSPCADHEVSVDAGGIWVNGSCHGSWGYGPSAFTIPWPVIEAIVAARATVG